MPSISKLLAVVAHIGLVFSQITVDVSSTLQEIDGFGFSEAYGHAEQLQALPSSVATAVLDLLFSTETGAGLTIIRNRIGSGGVGDSIEPTAPSSPSATPTYDWDGSDSGQVWFSKQAISYGVKTIYADAWSAPGFMKTNDNEDDGGYLCGTTGHTCSSGDWRQAYANYLLEYVKLYASEGIPITHLGFLNEPDLVTAYDSMQISSNATEAVSFIPILYDTLQSGGFSNVSITCCDAEGWDDQITYTAGLISGGVEKYLGVITSHAYSSSPTSPISTSLKVWQTEDADLNDDTFIQTWYSSGAAAEGLTWANNIAVGILNANLSAYLLWEGAEVNGSTSDDLVFSNGENALASGRLWAFAQWSRFVRPGAHRVTSSGSITDVLAGGFKNTDGSVVVVLTNTGSSAQTANITFEGFKPSAASAYLTDNSHNVSSTTSTVSGSSVEVSLTAHSVLTVKLTGSTTKRRGWFFA